MSKVDDNFFPKVILDGITAPAAPTDRSWKVYSMANGIFARSSNGIVGPFSTGAGGGVATDTIWDAAGDLAVGTGADTAAKLTLGASGKAPISNGSTLVYAFPPGYELDHVQITSSVNVTATSEATADTVVTGSAVSYDGSTVVMINFFTPYARPRNDGTAGNLSFWLYDGASSIGQLAFIRQNTSTNSNDDKPVCAHRRLTPSNASHTYSIKASVTGGTGVVGAGSGGSGNDVPAFIRITKV